MQYPSMNRNRAYRVTIPQLNGGVNYAVPPHLIEDNQLSDAENMWYKDGRLQTRPALCQVVNNTEGVTAPEPIPSDAVVTHLCTTKLKNMICVTSKVSLNEDQSCFAFDFLKCFKNEFAVWIDCCRLEGHCAAVAAHTLKARKDEFAVPLRAFWHACAGDDGILWHDKAFKRLA